MSESASADGTAGILNALLPDTDGESLQHRCLGLLGVVVLDVLHADDDRGADALRVGSGGTQRVMVPPRPVPPSAAWGRTRWSIKARTPSVYWAQVWRAGSVHTEGP